MFEGGGNDVMDGEGTVDGDGEDEGFGIDIADVDSSFMGDVDIDIIFCAQGWERGRLNDEIIESTGDQLDLWDIKLSGQVIHHQRCN